MNHGARVFINADHQMALELATGSQLPKDTQLLVALIRKCMPTEMFHPSDLVMDTTYLDIDIRIVRFSGSGHEGVRHIFMRKGAIQTPQDYDGK